VIVVYPAVKFKSGEITSKKDEILYAIRRDQESRQRQGLRAIFKQLKDWYGKTGFHVFGPKKEALRGRKFSSYEEVIGAMQN
jgi:hypothetical protein